MRATSKPPFLTNQQILPHGYFSFGAGLVRIQRDGDGPFERALVLAHGCDWSPQPVTLHRKLGTRLLEDVPSWFSHDYDHHGEIAVGDLTGSGFEDVIVSVLAGKDQRFQGGGVKVYYGGPEGLSREPVWIARGFSAFSLALGDFFGSGRLDIAVSSLWEDGSLSRPAQRDGLPLKGRTRFLVNLGSEETKAGLRATFSQYEVMEHEASGAACLIASDVDLDGKLDLVCGTNRASVLYDLQFDPETRSVCAESVFRSEESYPFCFALGCAKHPGSASSQLIVSSQSLFSLPKVPSDLPAAVLVHAPERGRVMGALQRLVLEAPAIPSALCLGHVREGGPLTLIIGALDASGATMGIAPQMHAASSDPAVPFDPTPLRLSGSKLMAARAVLGPLYAEPERATTRFEVAKNAQRVFTFERAPVFDIRNIELHAPGKDVEVIERMRFSGPARHFTSVNGTNWFSLSFEPPAGSSLIVHHARYPQLDLVMTSSAAWPPAGANAVYRGRPLD